MCERQEGWGAPCPCFMPRRGAWGCRCTWAACVVSSTRPGGAADAPQENVRVAGQHDACCSAVQGEGARAGADGTGCLPHAGLRTAPTTTYNVSDMTGLRLGLSGRDKTIKQTERQLRRNAPPQTLQPQPLQSQLPNPATTTPDSRRRRLGPGEGRAHTGGTAARCRPRPGRCLGGAGRARAAAAARPHMLLPRQC
jgi:hypothetical protein